MKTYSDKEITILNGVLSLAQAGEDINKLTSRAIAQAAGVGKATIYDYFSSKEEVIVAALLYSMQLQADEFALAMRQMDDFVQMMYVIINGVIAKVEDTGSIFHIMLEIGKRNDQVYNCDDMKLDFASIISQFMNVLYNVLRVGYKQGVIKMDIDNKENMDYINMVLISTIFSVGHQVGNKLHAYDHNSIVENAYTMLVKALS